MTTLAPYVRILARGPGRSRHLTQDEAAEAMTLILSGEARPEALGALFMLMRYRGENAAEIAGFTDAMRTVLADWMTLDVALDWPSYAAGRSRGAAWFVVAAKLIADAGYPILLHGWNSHQQGRASVTAAVTAMNIPVATNAAEAKQALSAHKIAYAPLGSFAPRLLELVQLRDVFGVRSPINTCLRALNPTGATASVQGVFHPVFRELQAGAAELLNQDRLTVLKGGGGEFERHPGKPVTLYTLQNGAIDQIIAEPQDLPTRRLADDDYAPEHLPQLWRGTLDDPFALATVLGTAAAALFTLGAAPDLTTADRLAQDLWAARDLKQD